VSNGQILFVPVSNDRVAAITSTGLDKDSSQEVISLVNGTGNSTDKQSVYRSIRVVGIGFAENANNMTDRFNIYKQGHVTIPKNNGDQPIFPGNMIVWDVPDKEKVDEYGRAYLVYRPYNPMLDIFKRDTMREVLIKSSAMKASGNMGLDDDFMALVKDYRRSLISLIAHGSSFIYTNLVEKAVDLDILKDPVDVIKYLEEELEEEMTDFLFPSRSMDMWGNTAKPGASNKEFKSYQETMENLFSTQSKFIETKRNRIIGCATTKALPGEPFNLWIQMS